MNVNHPVKGLRPWLSSLNCDGTWGYALLAVCAALLLPELAGEAGRAALRYDRAGLEAGELWRLVTAHIVHLDLEHAALNVLGLVMMWALFARDFTLRQWLLVLGASLVAIDLGLWVFDPEVRWYVGSSGVLHGVMAAGTLAHLRRGDLDGWILAAFILGKLAYEQWTGALPFEGTAAVVVNSHLYGVIGGSAAAAILFALNSRGKPR
jgi:rhomboid family GlyGly-CTERM serine protease